MRDDPRSVGAALKGSKLGEFWKYRVGDCRIVANIEDGALRILVLKVGNAYTDLCQTVPERGDWLATSTLPPNVA